MAVATTVMVMVAVVSASPACRADAPDGRPWGRQIQTGPKAPQRTLDGALLEERDSSVSRTGLAIDETGRSIRAGPSQPISVGLMGCPGCTVVLGAIGGLFVDVDAYVPPPKGRKRNRRRPGDRIPDDP